MSPITERMGWFGVLAGLRRRIASTGSRPPNRLEITENELFVLLADSRRRAVLDRVASADPDASIPLRGLARDIAAEETHLPPEIVPEERVEPVAIALRSTHLPMLDDAAAITWSADGSEIAPGPAADPITEGLDAVELAVKPARLPAQRTWSRSGPPVPGSRE